MLILLGTTLTTSFFDCLNPSAIAQQMMLQAMVNNKRHTLFFIFGIITKSQPFFLFIISPKRP